MGFDAPVYLKKALYYFSIIRIGFINGAEKIDAPVAASIPTSPSDIIYEIKCKNPNFGILLNPTPYNLGTNPDTQADRGDFIKLAFASCLAILGSTVFPAKSFAYY